MKRQKTKKRRRRFSMFTLMAVSTAALLFITVGLVIISYRTALHSRYISAIKEQLASACQAMSADGFSAEAMEKPRSSGIFVVVVDAASGQLLFDSRSGYLYDGQHTSQTAQQARTAKDLSLFIARNLSGPEGTFFTGDGSVDTDASQQARYEEISLYGRSDGRYFRLSCAVGSLNTAMELAIRFATIIGILVWVLCLLVFLIMAKKLTKPTKEISDTARKIAALDFSSRCCPAISREMDDTAQSVNTMADRLQESIEQLQDTNDRLTAELSERERQQRLNIELIANLSHDLKTPLAIISGYAEGLNEGIARTPEQAVRYSSVIFRETEHMQVIVSKMLALGRLEAGETPLQPSVFDAAELVRDIVQSFRLEADRAALQIRFEGETSLPVRSDYDSIRQILTNYIQNSIYHINGGNAVRIRLSVQAQSGEIAVANSSAPLTDTEKIWDRLYRGDSARQRQHGEIGLGLSIVRGSAERLGLPYGVRNLEDEHMVEFYIRLPLAVGQEEQI